jgi:hypothetical protein
MLRVFSETDPAVCQALWEKSIVPEYLTDLWGVRECFHRHYQRDFYFVVAEDSGKSVGLIPMSWISERNECGYFPGEVWHGTTWLEQNRLIARDQGVMDAMLAWLEKEAVPYHLRYLSPNIDIKNSLPVDEIGYLFQPPLYQFEMEPYFTSFNRRSIKSILKDEQRFYARGLTFRFDDPNDFGEMVRMNIDRFGRDSYFSDERFLEGFRDLMFFLRDHGWLRMVCILLEGQPVAVDLGAVYNNRYTLLAGGAHSDHPGIAKVINLFHMRRACEEKFIEADFLCGDFAWKTIFHLTPRPLYLMSRQPGQHDSGRDSVSMDSLSSG